MRRPLAGLIAAAGLAALAGCAMLPQPPVHLSGQWGGPHISLLLEGGLGKLEYDCASGTIDVPISPGPDGRFTATGTHQPGQGGPIRVGQVFISKRATYSGTVKKDSMTLSARLEDGTELGPFSLKLGDQGMLMRCL
jgi:hypothetical protein